MPEEDRQVYCQRCSSIAYTGDQFCGVCGAEIPPDAQEVASTEEIPTQVQVPQDAPTQSSSNRRRWILTVVIGALLVLLVGSGVAYAAFGSGIALLGQADSQSSEEDPPPDDEATQEPSAVVAFVSPDAPPDPAFDRLLPTLKQRTSTPIVLPAKLPDALKNVALDEDFRGEGYNIIFLRDPPDSAAGRNGQAEASGGLTARPGTESVSNEGLEAASKETVELPNGTKATLRYLKPMTNKGTRDSYWEGKFYEHGTTYHLLVLSEEISEDAVKQTLSTMVSVPQDNSSDKARTTPKSAGDSPPKKGSSFEEPDAAKPDENRPPKPGYARPSPKQEEDPQQPPEQGPSPKQEIPAPIPDIPPPSRP